MEMTYTKPASIKVTAVRCELPVNYDDEDMPNDYPHRKGDLWTVVIDIETGQIRDWPNGVDARHLHMKVVDGGAYELLNEQGQVVKAIEQDYVPKCIPGEYGDYVNFEIDANGRITNWKPNRDAFERSFFRRQEDD